MTWKHWAVCAQVLGRFEFSGGGGRHVDGCRNGCSSGSERVHNGVERVVGVGGARVLVAHGEGQGELLVPVQCCPSLQRQARLLDAALRRHLFRVPSRHGLALLFVAVELAFDHINFARCVEQWHSLCISLVLKATVRFAVQSNSISTSLTFDKLTITIK